MRIPAIALTLLVAEVARAQGTPVELRGVLPPESGVVERIVHIEPGARTTFLHRNGDLIVYGHASRTSTRLAERVWDATVSPKRDLVAFVRGGEGRTEHFIYALPLDPATGLAVGEERRLSSYIADAPSISPDGRFIAFARDDSSGVGQSLLVVPIGGGRERVLAANMPASIRSIAWTPDGRWIYFGVNPPVPCVPEWSCLPLSEDRREYGSIRRVSVDAGEMTMVVPRALGVSPGLSPDGSTIVYNAVGGIRRWVIANPDGSERGALSLSPSQQVMSWSGTKLLVGERQLGGAAIRSLFEIEIPTRRP